LIWYKPGALCFKLHTQYKLITLLGRHAAQQTAAAAMDMTGPRTTLLMMLQVQRPSSANIIQSTAAASISHLATAYTCAGLMKA
jgi:hypothetical protein